ncbi:helix-turn-helix transcriptional regulator [Streptomyces sp. NPDC007084]|uniref:helix-turn-helix domain-containing protein n=1 Tax=Streptomyces sp. NPDC007084 TaxID=3154313 RepID=UPI00345362C4
MPLLLAKWRVLQRAQEAGDDSVYKISQRTGVSQAALSRLFKGRSEPSLQTLWTFRYHYGLPVDEQVTEVAELPNPMPPRQRRVPADHIVQQPTGS